MSQRAKARRNYRVAEQYSDLSNSIVNFLNKKTNHLGFLEQPHVHFKNRQPFFGTGMGAFGASGARNKAQHVKNLADVIRGIRPRHEQLEKEGKAKTQELDRYTKQAQSLKSDLETTGKTLSKEEREIEKDKANYQRELSQYQTGSSQLGQENTELMKLTQLFQEDAPKLASDIKKYNQMPDEFLGNVKKAEDNKRRLSGYNDYEGMSDQTKQHEQDVTKLKQDKETLNRSIEEQFKRLQSSRANIEGRRSNLLGRWQQYQQRAQQHNQRRLGLEQRANQYSQRIQSYERTRKGFETKQSQFANLQNRIKGSYERVKNIEQEYKIHSNTLQDARNQLTHQVLDYQNWAQSHYNRADMHRNRANKQAKSNKIIAKTVGTLFGTPLGLAGNLLGLGLASLWTSNKNKSVSRGQAPTIQARNWQTGSVPYAMGGARASGMHAPISSGMLGNKLKQFIPQLGGLNSMQHFGMTQMPSQHELPTLRDSLGMVKGSGDLSRLTLGLPSRIGKDGKKYNMARMYTHEYLDSVEKRKRKIRGQMYKFYGRNMF